MIVSKIKYKYLYAWDMMMHSSFRWIADKQAEAESDNAPLDAIYKDNDGTWHRFVDIESAETKTRIQNMVDSMTSKTANG